MSKGNVKGLEMTIKNLTRANGRVRGALAQALYEEGAEIIRESQKRVPVDTGRLRSSAYVTPPESKITRDVVGLGYKARYASFVHELHAKKSKFLESVIKETQPKLALNIAKRMLKLWKK